MPRMVSFPLHPSRRALGPGQQTKEGRVLAGVSQGLLLTPAPQCLPTSLRLLPVQPGLLLSALSPASGSGREGRGLPAPRSPRAHSSASRMAAAPRAGGGQQVLGRAPRSRRGWVCFSHPVAGRSRQAPPHCAPSPRARSQPPPPAAPPSGRPRPRRAPGPKDAGTQPKTRVPPAVLRTAAFRRLSRVGGSRPGPTGLGAASLPRRESGPLPSSFAALPFLVRRPGLPCGDRAGQLLRLQAWQRPAQRPAHPRGPVPEPCEARAAGVCTAFY